MIYGMAADVQANPDKNVVLYTPGKTQLTAQDVFLGGPGTGVTDEMIGPATRVFGNTTADTSRALNMYEGDLSSQIKAAIAQNSAPRSDWAEGAPSMSRLAMEIQQAQGKISNDHNAAQLTGNLYGTPTLAQKTFDHGVSQDNFNNGISVGQLMGEYNGSPTLSKQAQAIQDAQFKATQAQNESQFGRSLGIQQQNANTSAGIYPNVSSSPYSSSINKYASQYGVPANLIDAVIGQESGGNSSATSSAGASGLMQLMPDTAKSLGVTDTSNVDQSIMGGTKYLSQQLSKYGSTELALAAYNAGPGAVDNAIKQAGTTRWSDVSQYLPSETRRYVPSVIGSVKNSSSGGKKTVGQQGDNATAMAIEAIQSQAPNMTRKDFNSAIAGIKSTWIRDGADFKVIQDAIDSAVTKDEAESAKSITDAAANAKAYNAKKHWWEATVK